MARYCSSKVPCVRAILAHLVDASPSRCTLAKATDQHHERAARLVSGLRPSRRGPSRWTS